ncbi:MAG: hypothetical protein IPJ34_32730 [Myxococcales bacterium]|nr:hypothetical protein [Myxococcales bacterium]
MTAGVAISKSSRVERRPRLVALAREAGAVDRDADLDRQVRVPHAILDRRADLPGCEDRRAPHEAVEQERPVGEQRPEQPRDELLVHRCVLVPGHARAEVLPELAHRPVDHQIRRRVGLLELRDGDVARVDRGVDEARLELRAEAPRRLGREPGELARDLLAQVGALLDPLHAVGRAPRDPVLVRGPERELQPAELDEELGDELQRTALGEVRVRLLHQRVVLFLVDAAMLEPFHRFTHRSPPSPGGGG